MDRPMVRPGAGSRDARHPHRRLPLGARLDDADLARAVLAGESEYTLQVVRAAEGQEAEPQVEDALHLGPTDRAATLDQAKDRQDLPGSRVQLDAQPDGTTRGRLSTKPPPVMCAMPRDSLRLQERRDAAR